MYELIFTVLILTRAGPAGSHTEHISRFSEVAECEKVKTSLVANMDQMVRENRMVPGVFECRKVQR